MPRARPFTVVVTVLAASVLVGFALLWAGVSRSQISASDFTASYVGGTLLREGHRSDLYDQAVQSTLHASLVAPPTTGNLPFVNPPAAALLVTPVTLLPLDIAYRVWQVLQVLMLAAAAFIAAAGAPWGAAARRARAPLAAIAVALAGTGSLALGLLGQWDGLSALGLAAAYVLWRRDARFTGGLVLAATAAVAKPHLALGLAALLVGWRDRRVLAGAAMGVAAVAMASLLAVGPQGLVGFAHAVGADAGRWPLASMLGFTGLTGSWLGDTAAAQLIALSGTAAAAVVCLLVGTRLRAGAALEPCLAAATLLSLLASPHLLSHDLVLLVPVLVALIGWTSQREAARPWPDRESLLLIAGWAALSVTAWIDLGSQQAAPPGRLVPVALGSLGALMAWSVLSRRTVGRRGMGDTILL